MQDVDAGGRELTGEIGALHSRITRLEQVSHESTTHKNVDEELDNAWREWKATFDAAKDSIILTDGEFRIVQANLAASQLFGGPLDQIIGKTCWQLIHGTDYPPRDCPLEKAKTTKKHEEIELYLPQKDVWVTASVDPVFDQQGNLSGAIHIIKDITDRKKAQEALQESEQKFRTIFDNTSDGMFLFDLEAKKFSMCNNAWLQMLGYTQEEFMNLAIEDLHPKEDLPFIYLQIEEFAKGRKGIRNDIRFKRKDRSIFFTDLSPDLITLDGKRHILIAIKDITERRRSEELLRKERDRAQKYLDVAGVMFVAIDAEQRVGLINKKGCEILGYTEEEIIAKNWFDNFLPERIKEDVKGVFNKLLCGEADAPEYYENPILTKNGAERLIAWHNTILRDDKGKVIAALGSGEDITERKQAEEALRESEEKYRDLFENVREAIITVDLNGNIADVNKLAEEYGFKREELKGKKYLDFTSERFKAKAVEEFARLVQGYPVQGETEVVTPAGIRAVEYRDNPILRAGKVVSIQAILTDITERKKMEEELREKEKKWTSLTENTNDIVMIVNNKGKLQYINKTIPPYAPKETVGKSVYEYVPKEQHDTMRNSLTSVFKTGKPETYEVSSVIPKLGTIWFSTKVVPIKIEENVVSAILISTDITERKKAEEALQHSEEYFRAITENSSDIIIIVDKKGTILYVSFSIERFSGYKPEELIGKSAFEFIHPDDFPRAVNDFSEAIQTKDIAVPNSFRIRHKDGSEFVLEGVGKNLLDNPVIKGFVMNVRDITDRKKAEQQLLNDQAQLKSLASELTLAEELARRRLAVELHDRISQALVISKIKLDALRKAGRSRKLDKALEDICDSIGQTIQDTRTLTFDLSNPVLYELGFETAVSEWLTDQIQKKHGLAVEFEDDKLPKPLDDDIRIFLFRDVRELLINVVKHAHAHKVKVSVRKLDNHICVTVEDDGVGFDPAEVISMAAKKGEFGLFSIRERLEGLGGHIQIDSAPGRGCKVTMTAPLKQKEMTQ
jgi:PAS domain S-box-containing protein